jgi:hypothetical protein
MKKAFFLATVLLAGTLSTTSCKHWDDDSDLQDISVVNAVVNHTPLVMDKSVGVQVSSVPTSTTDETIGADNITITSAVSNVSGTTSGTQTVQIVSAHQYSSFHVATQTDEKEAIVYEIPNASNFETVNDNGEYVYTFEMEINNPTDKYEGTVVTDFYGTYTTIGGETVTTSPQSMTTKVTGQTYVSKGVSNTEIDATKGLNISLEFDSRKDVDVYLKTPSGDTIYFGNPGMNLNGYSYGLDDDANAGCEGNSRSETISLPVELLENGVYTVLVDLYLNCDTTVATNWSIKALYDNVLVTPQTGENPASGTYAKNAKGSMGCNVSEVMTFTLSGIPASAGTRAAKEATKRSASLLGQMKLEEAQWYKSQK